jgi:hypothetical protein
VHLSACHELNLQVPPSSPLLVLQCIVASRRYHYTRENNNYEVVECCKLLQLHWTQHAHLNGKQLKYTENMW